MHAKLKRPLPASREGKRESENYKPSPKLRSQRPYDLPSTAMPRCLLQGCLSKNCCLPQASLSSVDNPAQAKVSLRSRLAWHWQLVQNFADTQSGKELAWS